jgi:hypothetical protein
MVVVVDKLELQKELKMFNFDRDYTEESFHYHQIDALAIPWNDSPKANTPLMSCSTFEEHLQILN